MASADDLGRKFVGFINRRVIIGGFKPFREVLSF